MISAQMMIGATRPRLAPEVPGQGPLTPALSPLAQGAGARKGAASLLISAVLLSGCWDFGARVDACRDEAGGWTCGDAGEMGGGGGGGATGGGSGGGAMGGGAGGGDVTLDADGLFCAGEWCWEHPRPVGADLFAVWARAANDVWVSGRRGTVLHYDGARWEWRGTDPNLDVGSLCGTDAGPWISAWAPYSSRTPRLQRHEGNGWIGLSEFTEALERVHCGSTQVWVVSEVGASVVDLAGGLVQHGFALTVDEPERCESVVEAAPGEALFACHAPGVVRIRRFDGGLAFEHPDDAGLRGPGFRGSGLWVDPTRGVLASIAGTPGEVWQQDAGWAAAWTSTDGTELTNGTPWAGGSFAVGTGGTVLDIKAGGITRTRIPGTSNGVLFSASVAPGATRPWAVGAGGCIFEPAADGGWTSHARCDVQLRDVQLSPRPMAISDEGRYERRDAGWVRVASTPRDAHRFAPLDDGGFVYLTPNELYVNQTNRNLGSSFSLAQHLVVSGDRIVFLTGQGQLIETSASNGTVVHRLDAGLSAGAPHVIGPVVDEAGALWAGDRGGVVLRSAQPGVWTPEQTGLTREINDLAVLGGRVWALAADELATRDSSGSWRRLSLPGTEYYRVGALSSSQAAVFAFYGPGLRVDSDLIGTQEVQVPLQPLSGRLVGRGGELWGVGSEGALIRFRPGP